MIPLTLALLGLLLLVIARQARRDQQHFDRRRAVLLRLFRECNRVRSV